jgi:hypothetical protein
MRRDVIAPFIASADSGAGQPIALDFADPGGRGGTLNYWFVDRVRGTAVPQLFYLICPKWNADFSE